MTFAPASTVRSLSLALACVLGGSASAGWAPAGAFVQVGGGENHLASATLGAFWPWDWKTDVLGGQASGYWEGSITHISARGNSGRNTFTQIAAVPMLRYTFDGGRSPWFVEAGIGVSLTDRIYRTDKKAFSTTFNFSDNLVVGRSLGKGCEISLRLQHVSNASIKRPNPGENFLQARYTFSY